MLSKKYKRRDVKLIYYLNSVWCPGAAHKVGIRPSWMARSSGASSADLAGWCWEDRAPHRHITADLIREKLMVHRIQEMVLLYSCCLLSARSDASHLYMMVAPGAMPPVAENTRGLNDPRSISRTRCS